VEFARSSACARALRRPTDLQLCGLQEVATRVADAIISIRAREHGLISGALD
jgi:hypothetical protein